MQREGDPEWCMKSLGAWVMGFGQSRWCPSPLFYLTGDFRCNFGLGQKMRKRFYINMKMRKRYTENTENAECTYMSIYSEIVPARIQYFQKSKCGFDTAKHGTCGIDAHVHVS